MTLQPTQQNGQKQQLIKSPQLIKAINILGKSDAELQETINEELQSNPMLEELTSEEGDGETRLEEKSDEVEDGKLSEVNIDERLKDDWRSHIPNSDTGWIESTDQTPLFENASSTFTEDLWFNLMLQLVLGKMNVVQREIGAYIIGNLNEDGYLMMSIEEICQSIGRYLPETVRGTLVLIQNFDPLGVAARDLKECLLIQARSRGLKGSIVETIIKDHLENVANRKCEEIAKSLSVPLTDVHSAVSAISQLDPRPGQRYNRKISGQNPAAFHMKPDIFVHQHEDDYTIEPENEYKQIGVSLRINRYYDRILNSRVMLTDDDREYLLKKKEKGRSFVKSLEERQKTICRVTKSIVGLQRDFFDTGLIIRLKPLISRDVAEDIQMNESTVRRAYKNKNICAPHGVFELKFFFDRVSIDTLDEGEVASRSVKELIKYIIKSENREKPYSDQEITNLLKADFNINANLRTVTKYREGMSILPSRQRKWPY